VIVCLPGDFDVPSSREEVDRDSMWNQWLRSEIAMVFVSALDSFKVRQISSLLSCCAGDLISRIEVLSLKMFSCSFFY